MASWAARRKGLYALGVLGVLAAVVAVIAIPLFYDEPNCFDGEQNGGELGIDCGGACAQLCEQQIDKPVVRWSRAFEVVPGVYNAVAYVENPNTQAQNTSVTYTFKLFDERNILIAERRGRTFLTRTGIEPIFEPTIETGNRVPARTFFEILDAGSWHKREDKLPTLSVENRTLTARESAPRLTAQVRNEGLDPVSDIEVVATLFDSADNAVATSRTVISRIESRTSESVVFTWPQPFDATIARIDIIPRIAPVE